MSRQKGEVNANRFRAWAGTATDEQLKAMVITYLGQGVLNKSEVSKASGVPVDALKKNPGVVKALKALESGLRARGVIPPLTEAGKAAERAPKAYNPNEAKSRADAQRLTELERDNQDLRAKVSKLESLLASNAETIDAMEELGIFKTLEKQA